jgi:hypothetical protein
MPALYLPSEPHIVPCPQIVIDLRSIVDNLPYSIMAFFYLETTREAGRSSVAKQHELFLSLYHLSANDVPLVRLDLDASEPFSRAAG